MQLSSLPQLDIVSIFKHYNFDLKESGDRYVCLCPFHNDKNTPNLTIYPKTNSFYCFTCKKSGDAFTLISFMEKKPIYEIKKELGTTFIKYKLTSQYKKPVDFFQSLLKDSAMLFYNYIRAYPENKIHYMNCMQQFDMYLEDLIVNKVQVDFTLYNQILDNLKKILYTNPINVVGETKIV